MHDEHDQHDPKRRKFLRSTAAVAGTTLALNLMPPAIRKALAIPAHDRTRSIKDVKHIVILMQENRSFDHYFGAMRGVRGFGDRFPIPLASGKPVWFQSDGTREISPYHLDKSTMNAALIPSTPHNFPDAQMAWNQGKFGFWPQVKTQYSMGYYTREEAPFQWALADAFTVCAILRSVTAPIQPHHVLVRRQLRSGATRGRHQLHRRQLRACQPALLDQGRPAAAGLHLRGQRV
jgi:phospholipase C